MKHINSARFISRKQIVILSAVAALLFIFVAALVTVLDTKIGKAKFHTQDLMMIPCFIKYII
jgi:hypothetical protein